MPTSDMASSANLAALSVKLDNVLKMKFGSSASAAIAGAEVESDTAATSTAISGRAPQRVSRRRYCNLDKGFILASKTAAM